MKRQRRIAITMGDPQGIGPEIAVKALLAEPPGAGEEILLIGHEPAFAGLPGFAKIRRHERIRFIEVAPGLKKISALTSGRLALASLKTAVALIAAREADALVTAPISKERIAKAGFGFPGHTEFLCHAFGVKRFAMMLFHSRLRIVLTTIHVPLSCVSKLITKPLIGEKLALTATALKEVFGLRRPRIAVCGLNPHAGENGLIGNEEKTVIIPAIRHFVRGGKYPRAVITGPHSADTVFHEALAGRYDAVLCHYHDQGLIPLKTTGFDEGVNMTLGLPFVRTSPDHGTAFDIAGRNQADPKSFLMALRAARGRFV